MHLENVLSKKFDPIEQRLSEKDCILYSLGIGIGMDPIDPKQLQFVYEKGLKAFPSHAVMIAYPGPWMRAPELEIDYSKLLHVGQSIKLHKAILPNRTYIGRHKVLGVIDKGKEKGALLYLEKTVWDKESDEIVSTITLSHYLRGDGGCGSSDYSPPLPVEIPDRQSDQSIEYQIANNIALIYRLSGDPNAIHVDPEIAKDVGFNRPILHGLCSFGFATRAALDTYCDSDPELIQDIALRFSAPTLPGESLRFDFWEDGTDIKFTATNLERNVKVLNNGIARIHHH